MITKQRLVAGLEESTYVEENMITLFTNFTKALVNLTEGLEEEKSKEIKKLLTRLYNDSTRHKNIITELLEEIKKSPRNEY